ncbi:MAG: hypothetical protein WBN92_03585, partial [Terriglobia bacterium]
AHGWGPLRKRRFLPVKDFLRVDLLVIRPHVSISILSWLLRVSNFEEPAHGLRPHPRFGEVLGSQSTHRRAGGNIALLRL